MIRIQIHHATKTLLKLNESNMSLMRLWQTDSFRPSFRAAVAGMLILWGVKLYKAALTAEENHQDEEDLTP